MKMEEIPLINSTPCIIKVTHLKLLGLNSLRDAQKIESALLRVDGVHNVSFGTHGQSEELGYIAIAGETSTSFHLGNYIIRDNGEWWYSDWIEVQYGYEYQRPIVFSQIQSRRDDAGALMLQYSGASTNVSVLLKESELDGQETPPAYIVTESPSYHTNETLDEWQQPFGAYEDDWLEESLILVYHGFEGDISDWITTSDVGSSIGLSTWAQAGSYSLGINDSLLVPQNNLESSSGQYNAGTWLNTSTATFDQHDAQYIDSLQINESFESYPFTNWTISDGQYVYQNDSLAFAGNKSAYLYNYLLPTQLSNPSTNSAIDWTDPDLAYLKDWIVSNQDVFIDSFESWGQTQVDWIIEMFVLTKVSRTVRPRVTLESIPMTA